LTVIQQYFVNGELKEHIVAFLHGYGVSLKVWFEGELDERNWVWDFGGMKRAKTTIDGMNPKAWLDYMLDHTTVIADDDPEIENFRDMDATEELFK
jgi:6-pyruvoyltetrahydropterin/6-carboxytetrahydropterin synthase